MTQNHFSLWSSASGSAIPDRGRFGLAGNSVLSGRHGLPIWLTAVLGMGIASMAIAAAADEEGSATDQRHGTIRVTGEGSVQAAPDMATATFGVVTESPSVLDAVAQNNEAVGKVIEALKERGVAAKDLQTSHFDITPLSRHDPSGQRQPEITGYRVSNQLSVKVRNLPDLGALLDAGVKAGANQMHGIQLSVSEPGQRLDEARREAMQDARRKAHVLADAVEARVGRALEISESTGWSPEPYPRAMRMAGAEASSVPIESGEQSLTARVSVVFALETAPGTE